MLALKLLDQLLDGLNLTSSRTQNALCRVFHQMKWHGFSGLQPLVLKGLTLPSSLTLTNRILVRLTPHFSTVTFLDSSQRGADSCLCYFSEMKSSSLLFLFAGLVVNILSLLPMLFESYDEPSEVLLDCSETIASVELIRLICDFYLLFVLNKAHFRSVAKWPKRFH